MVYTQGNMFISPGLPLFQSNLTKLEIDLGCRHLHVLNNEIEGRPVLICSGPLYVCIYRLSSR